MVKIGMKYTSQLVVAENDTAREIGSGDMPVLATPRMIALMENAAMLAIVPALEDNETSVGAFIELSHICPSGIGAKVSATANLVKIDGRKLHFSIVANEGDKQIGRGSHIRIIVDREKFLKKMECTCQKQ